jgi:hypothetical protein
LGGELAARGPAGWRPAVASRRDAHPPSHPRRDRRPATLAADLAAELGRETQPFKADVRRLKELGLTESLEVGYRLSPRGDAVLCALRGR